MGRKILLPVTYFPAALSYPCTLRVNFQTPIGFNAQLLKILKKDVKFGKCSFRSFRIGVDSPLSAFLRENR